MPHLCERLSPSSRILGPGPSQGLKKIDRGLLLEESRPSPATNNNPQTTNKQQQTTIHKQQTNNKQQTTNNKQQTTVKWKRAAYAWIQPLPC